MEKVRVKFQWLKKLAAKNCEVQILGSSPGRMGGWMDGWVEGWMDGWMDGWVGLKPVLRLPTAI